MTVSEDLIRRYALQVPRYTSYPTAPHFHSGVDGPKVTKWLTGLRPNHRLSLYAHVPFCDTLCWFCGCNTKQTLRYDPIARYLEVLLDEIRQVSARLAAQPAVDHIHLGGGSPTILQPADLLRLIQTFRDQFDVADGAEIAIEIDPRDMTPEKLDALSEAGVNRASIGVQDFDPDVQKAINRIQGAEMTADLVAQLRATGVRSLNLDVLYGLPHQTEATIARTINDVIAMAPDRVALFGYAHVPWMKTHQKMIRDEDLPGIMQRFALAEFAAELLVDAGFERVGFDHFARPDDALAIAARQHTMRRNFQGYTTDACDALIGFGASSVSEFPGGYSQNVTSTGEYMRRVGEGLPATEKGFALSQEDRVRRAFIERLLCDFEVDAEDFAQRHGAVGQSLARRALLLAQNDPDGIMAFENGAFSVLPHGRPFVRTIAAQFDAYMGAGEARHSLAV